MSTNYIAPGKQHEIATATTVDSGDPVVLGTYAPCVALVDANATTGKCVVAFEGIFDLKVAGKTAASTPATVTAGDALFYTSGATCGSGTVVINKYNTGSFFGIAMEGVTKGASTTIEVKITPAYLPLAVVTTGLLNDDAVTLAKLANIARGSVIVGGTADAPTALDAKATTKFLQGDGTDLKSVAISGDATVASGGALTIAALAVETGMLAANAVTSGKIDTSVIQTVSTTLTPALIKTLYSANTNSGISLVAAPGSNKFIEFISGALFLDYSGAAITAANGLTFNVGAVAQSNSAASTFLQGAADRIAVLQPLTAATGLNDTAANLANKALFIQEGTANPGTGGGATGTLTIHATYRIHDFA